MSVLFGIALIMSRKEGVLTDIKEAASSAAEYMGDIIMPGTWWQVANRKENAPYLDALHNAEVSNGVPENMLVALAYQESHFRPDIISGATRSSAGAVGIMQIVPKWHPDVDPLDPFDSIQYAGKFLSRLYNQFGSWEQALQAYNWGPGNLTKYIKGQAAMPVETSNYSTQIIARVESFEGAVT